MGLKATSVVVVLALKYSVAAVLLPPGSCGVIERHFSNGVPEDLLGAWRGLLGCTIHTENKFVYLGP